MRKKRTLLFGILAAVLVFGGTVYSAAKVKVIVNGKSVSLKSPPQISKGTTLLPIRSVAEALGAQVTWNASQHTVSIDFPDRESLKRQIELLQGALAPASADEAVQTWAKSVKSRNGAVQYAVLSPSLQAQTAKTYEEMNWVTGLSSPWVDSYEVSAGAQADNKGTKTYEVSFKLKTSTGDAGSGTVKVTVGPQDDKWFITDLQQVGEGDILKGIVVVPA
jgi:hypothetical protein